MKVNYAPFNFLKVDDKNKKQALDSFPTMIAASMQAQWS
jgi:hypothetical protein